MYVVIQGEAVYGPFLSWDAAQFWIVSRLDDVNKYKVVPLTFTHACRISKLTDIASQHL